MLTCACSDIFDWHYVESDNYTKYEENERIRCKSCGKSIRKNDLMIKFTRFKGKYDKLLKAWCFCESCADIYYNLIELNYCIDIEDKMPDLLIEYKRLQKEDNY